MKSQAAFFEIDKIMIKKYIIGQRKDTKGVCKTCGKLSERIRV